MSSDLTDLLSTFFDEAEEHLDTAEDILLNLEMRSDSDSLNLLFRAVHSLKGASGAVGLPAICSYADVLQDLLDRVRAGTLAVTEPLAELLVSACGKLRNLVDAAHDGTVDAAAAQLLIEELRRLARPFFDATRAVKASAPNAEKVPSPVRPAAIAKPTGERILTLEFTPQNALLQRPGDALSFLSDLNRLGEVLEVTLIDSQLPALAELDPQVAYLSWQVRFRSSATEAEVRDVFAFVEDVAKISLQGPPEMPAAAPLEAPNTWGELSAEAGTLPALGAQPPAKKPAGKAGNATIRVAAEKLDRLMNLVGELVIAEAIVKEATEDASPKGRANLREALEELSRHTRELQDRVMSMRMVPIGVAFGKLPRLVRDVSTSCHKEVALRISGEDTEIDKGMVEQLGDPLTHLIRNCVDHGIETPEKRLEAGKPAQGVLDVRAFHRSGSVVIEIADDGKGLDEQKILEKAKARGLVAEDARPTPEEIHALIFLPGFSTANAVTDISGRGVGMDVVRKNVESLGGFVQIHSKPGKGSTFQISLPLTLAILDGLLVRIGTELFVLPLTSVVEAFRAAPTQISSIMNQFNVVLVRGESMPVIGAGQALGVGTYISDVARGLLCVVEAAGRRVALLVDDVVGQAQVVIKSLESNYHAIPGVMGATILGDGRIALILDPHWFVRGAAPTSDAHIPPFPTEPQEFYAA